MSTWDKIITDSNRITDLTAPNATFSMNSQTIENVLGLEATASTDITLEHGTDKDIIIKENGTTSGTIGSLGGTSDIYGYKFFADGDIDTNKFMAMSISETNGVVLTYDADGSTMDLEHAVDGDYTVDAQNSIILDAGNGAIRAISVGGTYTPAHVDDITTKKYVDTRSIVNAMVFG